MATNRIATITDGEWEYPVYLTDEGYCIDLGGAIGVTDPIDVTLDEAMELFRQEV